MLRQQRHLNNLQGQRGRNNVGRNSKKMEWFKHKAKSSSWYRGFSVACCCIGLVSCQTIRDAAYSGTGAALGAGAATVMSGGVTAPMVGALAGASTGIVLADLTEKNGNVSQTVQRKSFFMLIEELVQVAGWFLVLGFLGPVIIGWLLPGPLERRKKNG